MQQNLKVIILFLFVSYHTVFFNPSVVYSQEPDKEISFKAEEAAFWGEEEILISATLFETTITKAPAIATVITDEEIRNMGARDMMDVLRIIPGADTFENPGGTGIDSFVIRGWGTDFTSQVLFMIDGHRLNQLFTGEPLELYDDLMVENIKRVEVIRGPGSALYGADAFSGVVNIITKDAEDINGLEAKVSGGSFDTKKINILGGKQIGQFSFVGDINYILSDGPKLKVERDSIFGLPFSNSPGKTKYNKEKLDIDTKIGYGDLQLRSKYTSKTHGPFVGLEYALNDETEIEIAQMFHELKFEHSITEKADINARVYYDYYSLDSFVEGFPEGFTLFKDLDGDGDIEFFPDGALADLGAKNNNWGTEIRLIYDLFDNNKIVAGTQFEWRKQYDVEISANYNPLNFARLDLFTDLTSIANWNRNEDRDILAVYIEDNWKITSNIDLTAGIRYDKFSDVGDTLNPRAGIIWQFMKDTYLKVLYGTAFRAPSFVELYAQNNPVVIGNPDLSPETVKTGEIGLEHDFNKNTKARINFFKSEIRDLIDTQTPTTPLVLGQFINKDGLDAQGVETEFKIGWGIGNYSYMNYAYLASEDIETGEGLTGIPSHKANIGVNLKLLKYFDLNTEILIRGERKREKGDLREDLPSYGLVNLTLTASNFLSTWEISASIYNLWDKRYFDPTPLGTMESDFPKEGRSFLVSAKYKF